MSVITKDLGAVTAYAAAVNRGYTGSREEFETLMASYAYVGEQAAESATNAGQSAQSASQSATDAETAKGTAQQAATDAQTAQESAQGYAQSAQQSAQSASQSATDAEAAKNTAVNAVDGFAAGAQQALDGVNQAGNNWKSLAQAQKLDAEAWAVGTRDGEDVGSSDPAYHNNAKYYAESAGTSATTASEAAQTATQKASDAQASAEAAAESARTLTIDATLTQSGQAADAKAVGDEIDSLKDELTGGTAYNYVTDKNLNTSGELVDETGTCVSEYILYTWTGATSYDCGDNTKLTYRIEFYDANKNHISGFRNPSSTGGVTYRGINVETQVTGGTVAYVRFSFKQGTAGRIFKSDINVLWVAGSEEIKGVIPTIGNINSLETTTKDNLVSAINEVAGKIPDISFPITPSDTDFFYTSPNILDPANVVNGQFVNQSNGEFATNVNHTRTDYVPVVGGKTYCIVNPNNDNVQLRYAFYDSTKTFIPNSGGIANLADINYLVVAPATAEYIIISTVTNYYPFMIADSNVKIAYADYGVTYLLPQYILSEDLTDLTINLPSKIYAVTGFETNIYYENLVENWEEYNFNVSCSKGQDMRRGYTITPTDADAGTYALSVIVSTKDGQSRKTASSTLVITPSTAGSGKTTKLLVLGDSTTANGTTIVKLHENFSNDSMTVNTLGTLGTAPNNMEGRGGWKFEFYNTLAERNGVTNPFYNPSTQNFDASYYFTNTGVTIPDWFFINLGINDMFDYTSDSSLEAQIQRCIDYCDAMIASIKSASASIKIGVCVTIPPNDSQDAFGKAYRCGQTRNRYKRNNLLWAKRIIAEYDNRESEDIYLIPIHTNLDTVYNMGMETLPVNARNTTVTYQSPIANGGVHPVESGYWQIADVYTAFLKAHAED